MLELTHEGIDLGDPLPDAGRARVLRARVTERLVQSFAELLRALSESLGEDVTALDAKIRGAHRLSPAIFIEHERLKTALLDGDAEAAMTVVGRLNEVSEGEWNGRVAHISGAVSQPWVVGALDHLRISAEADIAEGYVQVRPLPEAEIVLARDEIQQTLQALHLADPAMSGELREFITDIIVLDGDNLTGASSIHFFGAILLHASYGGQPSLGYYLDHLVHEASHHHLYAVLLLDPLVLNDPGELFQSPIRKDPRPMLGLYHGLFVLGRVLRSFGLAAEHDVHPFFAARIPSLRRAFDAAYETIDRHARLTPVGRRIVNGLATRAHG